MAPFSWLTFGLYALVVLCAAVFRGRFYAIFAGVILGIHSLVSAELFPAFAWCAPLYAYLQVSVYLQFLSLVRARLRSPLVRALVSFPAYFMAAGTLLAFPWAIASVLGFPPYGVFLPYLAALFGLVQTLRTGEEEIDVQLGDARPPTVQRDRLGVVGTPRARPLRIVQITDPHLGPFMSERRLRRIAERAVARNPDLILLTGDFLTMESHGAKDALARAFEPFRAMPGRVFACRGNHDLEAPDTVAYGLAEAGVRLLIDEACVVDTEAGRVQIVGIDFRFRERRAHMAEVCERLPRAENALRIVLLHDPGAFTHLPEGHGDLVLSGHTHGGQVGLLSLGLLWTALRVFAPKMPDHGFWSRGTDRLYVHRGTGVYGFPLRVGVPSEESVLRVHWT